MQLWLVPSVFLSSLLYRSYFQLGRVHNGVHTGTLFGMLNISTTVNLYWIKRALALLFVLVSSFFIFFWLCVLD